MNDKEYYTNILRILEIDLKQVKNEIDIAYLNGFIEETKYRMKKHHYLMISTTR